MASERLHVTFEGEGVADGLIDAELLGRAFIALAATIDAAKALDPELKGERLQLIVEATRQGSFDIQMLLEGLGSAWEAVKAYLASSDGEATFRLTEFVGVLIAFFAFVQQAKGAKAEVVEQDAEAVRVKLPDGTELTLSLEAWKLYLDQQVAASAADFVSVLGDDVESVRIEGAGQRAELTTSDREHFESHADRSSEDGPAETRSTTVMPVAVVLTGTGKWHVDEYGKRYSATMADESFKALVERGWAITSADQYKVTVTTTDYRTRTGQQRWRHTIVSVDEYRRAAGEPWRPLPSSEDS